MPRFKPYDYRQGLMVPINLEEQLVEGTLEYALHHLLEERVPDQWFEALYQNDEIGRPAYSPRLLLKVILLGYARGIIGSRRLERACKENITFLALGCGIRPDHSTLAAFIQKLENRIELIFSEVLLVCHEEGLLSGTHLSLDGVKLPGNASRESSGTFAQLRFKAEKLRRKVKEAMVEHRRQDRLDRKRGDRTQVERAREKERHQARVKKLLAQAERLEEFVREEEPREGRQGEEVQSNVTDKDSAKMTTSHGVIQGYNAQALVDGQEQIIVHARASGVGQDHAQLGPVLAGAEEVLELAGLRDQVLIPGESQLSADCNYHSEENLQACQTYELDPYIPDNHFRQRDPRFATQERYKSRIKKELFTLSDFQYEEKSDCFHCPQGKVLKLHARQHRTQRGETYRRYRAAAVDCAACPLRARCLTQGAQRRSLALPVAPQPATLSARMRRKIDQPEARRIYGRRLAIVEPIFANLRSNKRLDRFTYRGQKKVNIQWLLYCLVHNFEKLAHRSKIYGRKRPRHASLCLSWRLPALSPSRQTSLSLPISPILLLKSLASHLATLFFLDSPDLIIRQSR